MKVKIVAILMAILSIFSIFTAYAPTAPSADNSSTTVVETIIEAVSEEESTIPETTLPAKEESVKITSMKLDTDSRGDKVIVVGYSWTNVTDKATSFMLTFSDYVYQNGLECETAYFANDTSADMVANVLPGGTIEFTKAYVLRDDTSDILVMVKDWIGDTVYIELNSHMADFAD